MTWYVTTSIFNASNAAPDGHVWTVSEDPNKPGWGFKANGKPIGLTKEDAQFLADAANEKEYRDSDVPDRPGEDF